MGFLRRVSFPTTAALLSQSSAVQATVISGARCKVRALTVKTAGGTGGGNIRLRSLIANTDIAQVPFPAMAAIGSDKVHEIDMGGMLFPDGLRIVVDVGFSGTILVEEEPRVGQCILSSGVTLDQVRRLLGKSVPHPFNGVKKWGIFPTETATDATWNTAVDSETFTLLLPRGFTHQPKGKGWRLIVGHHQLSAGPTSVYDATPTDETSGERGYLFLSTIGILGDTWPNDNQSDSLEAIISWVVQTFAVNPDDINLFGFSLGGQTTLRFAATHRDPAGIMLRTAACVEPTLDMLAWYLKQWNNTELGQTVPNPSTLCDPASGALLSTFWRSQVSRLDNMGGAWPGSDGASAVGLAYRASGVLALPTAGYAETDAMLSLSPTVPLPTVADIAGLVADPDRSSIGAALWTPIMLWYGTNGSVVLIPPCIMNMIAHLAVINSDGAVGYAPSFINVGAFPGGSHTWALFDMPQYLDWIDQQPPTVRYPRAFEAITHKTSAVFSFLNLVKSVANDMSRVRCATVDTPGSQGWALTALARVTRSEIDMSQTPLASFAFGAGAPLKITSSAAQTLVVKNMSAVPAGATGTNIGTVSIPSLQYPSDPNSITIAAAGAGAMIANIT